MFGVGIILRYFCTMQLEPPCRCMYMVARHSFIPYICPCQAWFHYVWSYAIWTMVYAILFFLFLSFCRTFDQFHLFFFLWKKHIHALMLGGVFCFISSIKLFMNFRSTGKLIGWTIFNCKVLQGVSWFNDWCLYSSSVVTLLEIYLQLLLIGLCISRGIIEYPGSLAWLT